MDDIAKKQLEQTQQQQYNKGKRLVMIIAAINFAMQIFSIALGSELYHALLVQGGVSLGLILGVGGARIFYLVGTVGGAIISIVALISINANYMGWALALVEIGYRIITSYLLFKDENITYFFYEKKREMAN